MAQSLRTRLYRLPLVERIGLELLLGLLISLACLWLFALIAHHVTTETMLVRLDTALADELHAQATPASTLFYLTLSRIGAPGLWIVGVLVGVWFLRHRRWLNALLWAIALIGGVLLNEALKVYFARPRPIFAEPLALENSFSFPSGHAMSSLIALGLLAYFICRPITNPRTRILVVFAATLLTVLIGISRLTLGVHYLSDVVAGYAAGSIWLLTCLLAARQIERRAVTSRSNG